MSDKCIHCGDAVIEERKVLPISLSPFGLMHLHSSSTWCDDKKHLACLPQQGFE